MMHNGSTFVRSIGGARDIWIANELITYYILRALDQADGGHTNALPALDTLFVEDPMTMNDLSWEALLPFITLRSLSGRHVQGNMPFSQCDIRHASFRQQRELNLWIGTSIHTEGYVLIAVSRAGIPQEGTS